MFIKISDLLNKSVDKTGAATQIEAVDVLNDFIKIIDADYSKTLKNKVKPLYVKNKTLTVSCENQIAASELKLYEKKIIKILNHGKKEALVQTIRFLL